MTLRYLEIFLALARTPNMRDAAAQLFLSQAAVSSALRDFEAELGVALFDLSLIHIFPTAMLLSWDSPRTTGSVARTAAAPQTELPAAVRRARRRGSPKTFMPSHEPPMKVLVSMKALMARPLTPTRARS